MPGSTINKGARRDGNDLTCTPKNKRRLHQNPRDQTGHFPATSSRGNKYIMVSVEVDGNYIDAEPMENKSKGAMIKAYIALWTRLTASGTVKPTTHILDNEASEEFKREIQKNCTIQLVPPDNHRQNLAE